MRLELSRKAVADLDAIRDYSVERFGTARAIAYLDAVEIVFRRLLDFPELGAVHSDMRPVVRSVVCQRHRVFYRIEGKAVVVVRVLHKVMDTGRHL